MERIGIAASKMAKGNWWIYNLYVVLLSFLFSLFIFLIAGATVFFAIMIMAYVSKELKATDFERSWSSILTVCMGTLTVLMAFFNIFAILKNIKFPKAK